MYLNKLSQNIHLKIADYIDGVIQKNCSFGLIVLIVDNLNASYSQILKMNIISECFSVAKETETENKQK